MTIKQFIEKAIEGGWECPKGKAWRLKYSSPELLAETPHRFLVDSDAWRAVGKTEGWVNGHFDGKPTWQYHMHRMIDTLIAGETIEELLATL